ncbi:MAG TPA: hypothetical protein VIH03_07870 [Nitrososphaerales archaeon]
MARDRSFGALFLITGMLGILAYLWLLFLSPYDLILLKITALVAVASIFGILAFIGFTMVTTPAAMPVGEEKRPEVMKEPQSSPADTKKK